MIELRALEVAAAELLHAHAVEQVGFVAAAAAQDGLEAEVLVLALIDADDRLERVYVGPPGGRLPADLARLSRSAEPVFQGPVAALPLVGVETTLGVLVLQRDHAFTSEDRAFMMVLAALCASAVERVRHAGATQRTIGRMRVDLTNLRIEVQGLSAHLTPSEFRLLMFLAEEPGVRAAGARSSRVSGRPSTSRASAPATRTSGTCGARSSATRRGREWS